MTPRRGVGVLLRGLALLAIAGFAGAYLAREWEALTAVANRVQVRWPWVGVASGIVLVTYAALVQAWRLLLAAWATPLPYGAAARIWSLSNLARWVPGRVWSIGLMGYLSRRAGVSPTAAVAAAVVGTALNLGAGFAVVVISGSGVLDHVSPYMRAGTVAAAIAFLAGVLALPTLLPALLRRSAARIGADPIGLRLPARTLWGVTAIHAASWVGYGIALACFTQAVLPEAAGTPWLFIALFAAPYLTGYLFVLAPGGLGAREVSFVALAVAAGLGTDAEMTMLALSSRLWLTCLEILPGLLSLVLTAATDRAALASRS